jgi:antitoxin (DNA-binding transcriptional repressor) of toxin-antitoxin stability system
LALSPETAKSALQERRILRLSENQIYQVARMEEINVTSAARNLSELLNRVAYQGASFELKRGGKSIARLVPAGPAKGLKVSGLNDLFARLPRLDEDGDAFARDVEDIRRNLPPEKDSWD